MSRRPLAGKLRDRLAAGIPSRGIFVKLAAPEVAQLAATDLDFVVLDLEHSQTSPSEASEFLAHARAIGLPALVRVASLDAGEINSLLEAGACGIQLSTVTEARQVDELIRATRHAPVGGRSVSLSHPAAGFGSVSLADYLAMEEADPPLLVVQLETRLEAARIESILARNPDVAFIGKTDLSVSVGLDRPALEEQVELMAGAVRSRPGVSLGGFALGREDNLYIVDASDLSLLAAGLASAGTMPG